MLAKASLQSSCISNTKLPFGYNYVDKDLDITHDRDQQGEHGSHVAGISTANAYIPNADGTFSNALDAVKVQGVAPDAQLHHHEGVWQGRRRLRFRLFGGH